MLRKGNMNRTTEPTAANKVSSRSHAVLQVSKYVYVFVFLRGGVHGMHGTHNV